MSATLLTPKEWEDLLRGHSVPGGQVPALGTIMEVLEVAEASKKGRARLDETVFRAGWRTLRERTGALRTGSLFLASLDQDGLSEALFDRGQGPDAVDLWPPVATSAISPARSVRRLILRPSDTRWWGGEAYDEMEERLEEEPGRNA
jgi:hypothetical protein